MENFFERKLEKCLIILLPVSLSTPKKCYGYVFKNSLLPMLNSCTVFKITSFLSLLKIAKLVILLDNLIIWKPPYESLLRLSKNIDQIMLNLLEQTGSSSNCRALVAYPLKIGCYSYQHTIAGVCWRLSVRKAPSNRKTNQNCGSKLYIVCTIEY